jgi:hypothetical protein
VGPARSGAAEAAGRDAGLSLGPTARDICSRIAASPCRCISSGSREPRSVVFDEVWFGDFVNAYTGSHAYSSTSIRRTRKLLVAGVAALGGYRGDQDFAAIHTPITKVDPALLRCVPRVAAR